MGIEITKDIDRYKETVFMGLTARQFIFSVLSVFIGSGLVLLLYKHIGLTASAYVAVPVVAPIALNGFYSYNGMTFMEVMQRKVKLAFFNKPLTYVSTESEETVKGQKEEEAREFALVLEAFVEGSLNIFNHRTNVDMSNRFIVYGIQDLGAQLAPVAMMVMMESIQAKIIENGRNGRATWLYIDEIHVLLNSDYCTRYLQQLWKKVRKQGGICTGISQNISDLLENDIVATLISNSEFMALLKQSGVDSPEIAKVLEVSKTELEYVKDANVGRGLIKCGKTIVPFDNTINEDSGLYQMFSTNFYERVEKGLIDDGASALMDEDVYGETTRLDETTVLKRSRRKGG